MSYLRVNEEMNGSLRIVEEQELGFITYREGRDYPWEAKKGNVMKYFATQKEAFDFITGK